MYVCMYVCMYEVTLNIIQMESNPFVDHACRCEASGGK